MSGCVDQRKRKHEINREEARKWYKAEVNKIRNIIKSYDATYKDMLNRKCQEDACFSLEN